jgi:hypothetical protein
MPPDENELLDYDEIRQPWTGILVGNGASRAISSSFAYSSLYEVACSSHLEHALTDKEQAFFDLLQTRNFEQALSTLATARFVNKHFGITADFIEEVYERIRLALVHAVQAVHTSRWDIPETTLDTIADCLARYDFVYSTNYDLLVYWAMMRKQTAFADYFFSGARFDPGNTEVWRNPTRVHFLHGALHLYINQMRDTFKRYCGDLGNLIEAFGRPLEHDETAVPLFVSEGTSRDKLRSILNSTYLSHVYGEFSRHSGPLIVFGQALDNRYDSHLLDAMRKSPNRTLGIAIYPGADNDIPRLKADWRMKFPSFDLQFFDSRSHALGNPGLAIS